MSIGNRVLRYMREAEAAEKQSVEPGVRKGTYLRISQEWKVLARASQKTSYFTLHPNKSLTCKQRQSEFGRRRRRLELEAKKYNDPLLTVELFKIATQWKILERTCEKLMARTVPSPHDGRRSHRIKGARVKDYEGMQLAPTNFEAGPTPENAESSEGANLAVGHLA
jgi:hypothetical protein